MSVKETVIRKAGLNRGKRRVWIEGKLLSDAGFNKGVTYTATVIPHKGITLVLDKAGKKKVSGKIKPDGTPHPIIDLTGDAVAEAINHRENVSVTFIDGVITIVGA